MDHNYLAIDFGLKNIGLAYSCRGVISTLPSVKNDSQTIGKINEICSTHSISRILIGYTDSLIKKKIVNFALRLSTVLKLDVNLVDEAVSTIEAKEIMKNQGLSKKMKLKKVDSVAAAVILRRVIG